MADQLNLPQLLAVVLVGILAIRWYFTAPTPSEPTPSRIPIEQLEQIQQMFPQLEARTILFNLQRNGDNISAFTEHVLSGRTLAIPPPSFQPPIPTRPVASSSTASTETNTAGRKPDLITRYNLGAKISSGQEMGGEEKGETKTWSSNKNERAALLQKRREEMILKARRKLQEKERSEGH